MHKQTHISVECTRVGDSAPPFVGLSGRSSAQPEGAAALLRAIVPVEYPVSTRQLSPWEYPCEYPCEYPSECGAVPTLAPLACVRS